MRPPAPPPPSPTLSPPLPAFADIAADGVPASVPAVRKIDPPAPPPVAVPDAPVVPLPPSAAIEPLSVTVPDALMRTRPPPAPEKAATLAPPPDAPYSEGAVAEPYVAPPLAGCEDAPPVPPWPAPPPALLVAPEPVVPKPEPLLVQTFVETFGPRPVLVDAAQPFALALMLVPESCVKAVRFVKRTLPLMAVPEESVSATASSSARSPSLGRLTVRPDHAWSSPAGTLKSTSVFCVLLVMVTPVPIEKSVPAERLMAPFDVSDDELPRESADA